MEKRELIPQQNDQASASWQVYKHPLLISLAPLVNISEPFQVSINVNVSLRPSLHASVVLLVPEVHNSQRSNKQNRNSLFTTKHMNAP